MNTLEITKERVGVWTKKEIFHQPKMWKRTYDIIFSYRSEISDFLKNASLSGEVDMVLTGAGSSAFVGDAVFGLRMESQNKPSRVIPTTDLITHPDYYLLKEKPTLLVSFARSGDSPESLAAVDVVDRYCDNSYHIIITCNENGALYLMPQTAKILKILLPPETNDVSLAMTSSFTSMMLAFILVAKIDTLSEEEEKVRQLSGWANEILSDYEKSIEGIAAIDFKRAVFLGSGPLRGTAEESHLKLQELTDGDVFCTFNSFLGFRHGPRAVVNNQTLLVYLFADDEHTRKYEYDLVKQINSSNKGLAQVSVSHKPVNIDGVRFDLELNFGKNNDNDSDIEYLCVAEVLFAQLLGFYKSIKLGLNPDNPSKSGTISRVVEGVKIYQQKFN